MVEKSKVNRRQFIKLAGSVIGGTILTCSGATFIGTRRPKPELSEVHCAGDSTDKILVTYATRCGSTVDVAEKISQTLCASGATVDVLPIKEVGVINDYRAVLVGSAIRMGRWLSEAKAFVETHKAMLATVPTAYFTVCLSIADGTEDSYQEATAYADPVSAILEPVDVGLFAGALIPDKLSFVERTMMNAMDTPQGDFRDWDAIQAWTENLLPKLA